MVDVVYIHLHLRALLRVDCRKYWVGQRVGRTSRALYLNILSQLHPCQLLKRHLIKTYLFHRHLLDDQRYLSSLIVLVFTLIICIVFVFIVIIMYCKGIEIFKCVLRMFLLLL